MYRQSGTKGKCAVLSSPAESDDQKCNPGAPGKRLQAGKSIGLIGCFFRRRPDHPPKGEAIHLAQIGKGCAMNEVFVGVCRRKSRKEALREIAAAEKEGKDQQIVAQSEPQIAPPPQSNRPKKVAKPDALPAREIAQADQAADIHQRSRRRSTSRPPHARVSGLSRAQEGSAPPRLVPR